MPTPPLTLPLWFQMNMRLEQLMCMSTHRSKGFDSSNTLRDKLPLKATELYGPLMDTVSAAG
eukprot:362584-Chlamydomonas_euryale.AAC.3